MATVPPWTEQWQHVVSEAAEQLWGELSQRTREAWQRFLEVVSLREQERYLGLAAYERAAERQDYRNGFYWRDFITRFGTLRLRIARTRAFLPPGLEGFQRWAPEVALLIREAFLRGLSTRQVGRVVALLTGEPVSAQTVSQLTRALERLVEQFHHAPLGDHWRSLFLDGGRLKVRRPAGRKRVQLLVA